MRFLVTIEKFKESIRILTCIDVDFNDVAVNKDSVAESDKSDFDEPAIEYPCVSDLADIDRADSSSSSSDSDSDSDTNSDSSDDESTGDDRFVNVYIDRLARHLLKNQASHVEQVELPPWYWRQHHRHFDDVDLENIQNKNIDGDELFGYLKLLRRYVRAKKLPRCPHTKYTCAADARHTSSPAWCIPSPTTYVFEKEDVEMAPDKLWLVMRRSSSSSLNSALRLFMDRDCAIAFIRKQTNALRSAGWQYFLDNQYPDDHHHVELLVGQRVDTSLEYTVRRDYINI